MSQLSQEPVHSTALTITYRYMIVCNVEVKDSRNSWHTSSANASNVVKFCSTTTTTVSRQCLSQAARNRRPDSTLIKRSCDSTSLRQCTALLLNTSTDRRKTCMPLLAVCDVMLKLSSCLHNLRSSDDLYTARGMNGNTSKLHHDAAPQDTTMPSCLLDAYATLATEDKGVQIQHGTASHQKKLSRRLLLARHLYHETRVCSSSAASAWQTHIAHTKRPPLSNTSAVLLVLNTSYRTICLMHVDISKS
eukprot:4588-Heterococcus_DN1.PRE.2